MVQVDGSLSRVATTTPPSEPQSLGTSNPTHDPLSSDLCTLPQPVHTFSHSTPCPLTESPGNSHLPPFWCRPVTPSTPAIDYPQSTCGAALP